MNQNWSVQIQLYNWWNVLLELYSFWNKLLLNSSIWTGEFWCNLLSDRSDFSVPPSWSSRYFFPKNNFWILLFSQDYFICKVGWLWLDLNTKKWFTRPNLSLIKKRTQPPLTVTNKLPNKTEIEKIPNLRNLFCTVALVIHM